jgi:hypothetical protein
MVLRRSIGMFLEDDIILDVSTVIKCLLRFHLMLLISTA